MTFCRTIPVIGFAACSLVAGRLDAAENADNPDRPNIVFILIDDLGAHDLGITGSDYYETPNLDRLARNGMLFDQGYANAVVCSPARAAIYTGQYPARNKFTNVVIGENHDEPKLFDIGKFTERQLIQANAQHFDAKHLRVIPHEHTTFAEALRDEGYTTGFIGKWHCGYSREFHPDAHGWTHAAGFRKFHRGTTRHWGRHWQDILYNVPDMEDDDYLSDYLTDLAVRFIDEHHDNEPFMLTLSHYLVHTPLTPRPDLAEKYRQTSGEVQRNFRYAAMVEAVDESVGRVLEALEKHGVADNTMVVFTSDQGALSPRASSNLPLKGGKSFPYEGGVRIPFIITWPDRIAPESRSDERVMQIDLYPTFCEAAGVDLPENQHLDGVSLMPLLTGSGGLDERPLFWYYPHYTHAIGPYASVISEGWKLIRHFNDGDGGAYELYDLRFDPHEYKDLAGEKPGKVEELARLIEEHLNETEAYMPRPNPEYDPDKPSHKGLNFTKEMAESQRLQLQTEGTPR